MYYYETHMHTSESSACASSSGAEQVRMYKEKGYAGIIITDHFLNGSTNVPKALPWEERIDAFCRGYENAKKEGDKIGLDVMFGLENNYHGQEFLIYGIDKEWLYRHPEIEYIDPSEQYRLIKAAGGMVIQAHPYREDWYIQKVICYLNDVDGLEVYNLGNERRGDMQNVYPFLCARKYNMPATCGSDCHNKNSQTGGMGFERKLNGIHDFIDAVLNKEPAVLYRRLPQEEIAVSSWDKPEEEKWEKEMMKAIKKKG